MTKIGFAITASYCNIDEALISMALLSQLGYDLIPITSPTVITKDTRFGKGEDIKAKIEEICHKAVITNLIEAERFGSLEPLDLLVIAPATGNTIAKLANGITDTSVTMTAKATLRNNSPVVIAVSTNDGLGLNGINIMQLYNTKNIYFVPFSQDDYINKPNSLIANYDLLPETIEQALTNKQYQPLLKEKKLNN